MRIATGVVRHADAKLVSDDPDHVSVIVNLTGRHRVAGRFDGSWRSESPLIGTVTVLPHGMRCDFSIEGACTILMLRLPASPSDELMADGHKADIPFRLNTRDDELLRLMLAAASLDQVPAAKIEARLGAVRAAMPGASRRRLRRIRSTLALIEAEPTTRLLTVDLAKAASTSQFHFARSFKAETGETPHRYLLNRRADRALELLASSDETIDDIARRSGFAHSGHLTRVLRARYGLTARAIKRAVRIVPSPC